MPEKMPDEQKGSPWDALVRRCQALGCRLPVEFMAFLSETVPLEEVSTAARLPDSLYLSWIEWLRSFATQLQVVPTDEVARRLVDRLGKLQSYGFSKSAVAVALAWIGVHGSVPDDDSAILEALNTCFCRSIPAVRHAFVAVLSNALNRELRWDEAERLIQADAGLVPADYDRSEILRQKLQRCLAADSPDGSLFYLYSLMNVRARVVGAVGRIQIFEAFFGLDAGVTEEAITRVLDPLFEVSTKARGLIGSGVTAAYQLCGRLSEFVVLFRVCFGLTDSDHEDSSQIADRIRTFVRPPLDQHILISTMWYLRKTTTPTVTIEVLALLLGASGREWRDGDRLVAHLCSSAARFPFAGVDLLFIGVMADTLRAADRPRDGLSLISAYLLGDSHLSGTEMVTRLVQALPREHGATTNLIVGATARLLNCLGRHQAAIDLILAELCLSDFGFSDPARLAAGLDARRELLLNDDTNPGTLREFCDALNSLQGRDADLLSVIEAVLWGVLDIEDSRAARLDAAGDVCWYLAEWFRLAGKRDASLVIERCRQSLRYLRDAMEQHGVSFEDRRRFQQQLGMLRGRIVQTGLFHVSQFNGHDSDKLREEVFLWDVELGQRLLFEGYRFRGGNVDRDSTRASDASVLCLKRGWSLKRGRGNVQSYLPISTAAERGVANFGSSDTNGHVADAAKEASPADRSSDLTNPSLRPARLGVLRDNRRRTSQVMPIPIRRSLNRPEEAATAEQVVRRGVDSENLAEVLGPRTVVLRAGFLENGKLYWHAFRPIGGRLQVIGHGASPDGSALAGIRSAVAWHDQLLDAIWKDQELGNPLRRVAREIRATLGNFISQLGGRRSSPAAPAEELERRYQALCELCRTSDVGMLFLHWMEATVVPGWQLPPEGDRMLRRRWNSLLELIGVLAEAPLERRLDAATCEFVHWVARHCDLDPLADHLEPEDDLVFEVDDALHAVPVAFLPLQARGGWLFSRVRSVRAGLSMLLTLAHADSRRNPQETGSVILVSWFDPHDPDYPSIRRGEWWLHAGQAWLAEREQVEFWTAGADPPGGVAAVQAGVSSHARVRLLTICGHGDPEQNGVWLSDDRIWDGSGCDLSNVDFLLLVSCSIGRLSQTTAGTAVPDVVGFVANLMARRAAAALACRWPVHALQAPWFANSVADAYLAASNEADRAKRALALAHARCKFINSPDSAKSPVGLNTLAAFELYGEG